MWGRGEKGRLVGQTGATEPCGHLPNVPPTVVGATFAGLSLASSGVGALQKFKNPVQCGRLKGELLSWRRNCVPSCITGPCIPTEPQTKEGKSDSQHHLAIELGSAICRGHAKSKMTVIKTTLKIAASVSSGCQPGVRVVPFRQMAGSRVATNLVLSTIVR